MPEAMRLVEWGISWVKSRAGLVSSVEFVKCEIFVLESELSFWKEFIDRNPSDEDRENKKAHILYNENTLNALKKLYNICNNKRKRGT